MICRFWNPNNWNNDQNSDNFNLRQSCFNYVDMDILCISESKRIGIDPLDINGFEWFGHNRTHLHKNAKVGSGGVGVLIRKSLLQWYKITVLDKTYEGILWIKFTSKDSEQTFNLSMSYLPPEGSTRNIDVNDFYETLLSQIYMYQNEEVFLVCGDFNSRNSDTPNFIEGVDDVPERETVDFTQNIYGDRMIDFLLSSNCCVLNGRKDVCSNNDYTSISVKGLPVVDYCLVPNEALPYFSDFKVHRSR